MGKNNDNDTFKKVALGSLIAGTAGYLVGILTAPKSGKETRQDVKDTAAKTYAQADKELKRLNTELGKVIDQAKTKAANAGGRAQKELNDLIQKAKDTKEKVREVISAVHEGDADDKDLANAIKEANKAIDHLKGYMKK